MIKTNFTPTPNQAEFVRAILEHLLVVAEGPPGSGKTLFAILTGLNQLYEHQYEKLLICKSMVSVGRQFPALPGDIKEKINPYFAPILEYFNILIPNANERNRILSKHVELNPVELLRGHTYNNTFIIVDETQNIGVSQLKMVLGRVGRNSKVVLIGDISQKDTLYESNGLEFCCEKLQDVKNCEIIRLNHEDIMRNKEMGPILRIFDNNGVNG